MKTKILTILKENGGYVSGQALCSQLGVSRTAVWKAVKLLEEEGCRIEAVRNKGYRLLSVEDGIGGAQIGSLLKTKYMGRKLVYFRETDSTNIQIKKLAEAGSPEGTLVVAESQTAGKGRRGRGNEAVYEGRCKCPQGRRQKRCRRGWGEPGHYQRAWGKEQYH